jgi:transcriptional regulator with XRE-family HTH domain
MVLRVVSKVRPKNMSAISATLCKVPNARMSIPAAIGVSARTVENWLSGATQPTYSNIIALMREFDEVADLVLHESGRRDSNLTFEQRRKLLEVLGEK